MGKLNQDQKLMASPAQWVMHICLTVSLYRHNLKRKYLKIIVVSFLHKKMCVYSITINVCLFFVCVTTCYCGCFLLFLSDIWLIVPPIWFNQTVSLKTQLLIAIKLCLPSEMASHTFSFIPFTFSWFHFYNRIVLLRVAQKTKKKKKDRKFKLSKVERNQFGTSIVWIYAPSFTKWNPKKLILIIESCLSSTFNRLV